MLECCRLLHHIKKKQTGLVLSAVCLGGKGKGSCSDKRKKESGAVAGESEVQRLALTHVNVRHFRHLLHLLETRQMMLPGVAWFWSPQNRCVHTSSDKTAGM